MRPLLISAAALCLSGVAFGLLRLASALRAPPARCTVCGCEVDTDPTDAAPICQWHWGPACDA